MSNSYTKQIIRLGMLAVGIIFVLLSMFSLKDSMMMDGKSMTEPSGCIFSVGNAPCTMSFTEHLSQWQSIFTALPQYSTSAMLIALLFIAPTIVNLYLVFRKLLLRLSPLIAEDPNLPFYDPLRQAFSQGIIHPKIYEFALAV